MPSVNFTPKLVIAVGDDGISFSKGPRDDVSISIEPPVVGNGTVVQIVNQGTNEHRLQGGVVFDTGRMAPGETTTVALFNDTENEKVIEMADSLNPTTKASIVVKPAREREP